MKNFEFKKFPWDFVVEEKLYSYPSGKGGVFYVFFEKKYITTFDVLFHITKKFGISRKDIGITGLKDKVGITRQRLTLYKGTLERKCGGKEQFLNHLSKVVKILKVSSGEKMLNMGANKGNLFFIRLRNYNKSKKYEIEKAIENIKNGFPNYFGQQRFGDYGKNWKKGKELLLNSSNIPKPTIDQVFKVQAFSSYVFNQYLGKRIYDGLFDKIIDGDILYNIETKEYKLIGGGLKNRSKSNDIKNMVVRNCLLQDEKEFNGNSIKGFVPTGPIIGYNLLVLADFDDSYNHVQMSKEALLEKQILDKNGLCFQDLQKFKKFDVFGLRRVIKVFPKDIRYKFDKNDLLIMFELPSGSYASSMIEFLDKTV